jgi:hypothetical protein
LFNVFFCCVPCRAVALLAQINFQTSRSLDLAFLLWLTF